jgi:DNA-binding phage protein
MHTRARAQDRFGSENNVQEALGAVKAAAATAAKKFEKAMARVREDDDGEFLTALRASVANTKRAVAVAEAAVLIREGERAVLWAARAEVRVSVSE